MTRSLPQTRDLPRLALQDGAGAPVGCGEDQVNILAGADQAVAAVVGRQHRVARRTNQVCKRDSDNALSTYVKLEPTQRELDDHPGWRGLLRRVELSRVHVVAVQPHGSGVGQPSDLQHSQLPHPPRPHLLNRLEPELVRLELVGETGGLGGELLRDVPQPVTELQQGKI